MPIERKLAAIMFTDIAGYTEQMSKSESKSLVLLEKKRSILKPLIKELNGTFVKEIGDGTLSYFESAVNASTCAVKLQEQTYNDEDLNIRAGIHIGDIVFKDDDVFGDGVNIASRLESIAPQGGVCVSKNVYDELLNQDGFDGVELGLQSLKGVGRLIEVFGLIGERLKEPNPEEYKENEVKVHSDDEVPSIAIIPFDNKGAEEDVFYAYGISADLISDVSGAGLIRVAGLKDIEKLDYANLKYEELSEKLLVRYIAQGTLWKMGEMFQLSIELYDTKDKKVVWSDRWQEKWENLPNIKVNLSDGLLKSLDTKPEADQKAETSNPEAYEFYLKAIHKFIKRENKDDAEIAQGLVSKAIELDDNLIKAKAFFAHTYTEMGDNDNAIDILIPALKQAQKLGDKDGEAAILSSFGTTYTNKGNLDLMISYYEKALEIYNETGNADQSISCLFWIGYSYKDKGDLDKALGYYERAIVIAVKLDDKRFIKWSLIDLAEIYKKKGDIHTAIKLLSRREAIDVTELTKHDTGIAILNDGMACYQMFKYENAIECLNNASRILEQVADIGKYVFSLFYTGLTYNSMGSYDKALDNFKKSLAGNKELGDKFGMAMNLYGVGYQYYCMGDNEESVEYLEESNAMLKEVGVGNHWLIQPMTALFLVYKSLGREFDKDKLDAIASSSEIFDYYINIRLYQLLDDRLFLENAHNQVEEISDLLETDMSNKFLSYPIPKAIVEEWEKVN
jgi:class 3 adenylate cyclase/tetratricopeptide (TPR) repeat protein